MEKDIRVWGIHSEDDNMFLDKNNPLIAIGWRFLGDLRKYGADREKIKAALIEKDSYYRDKMGAVPNAAGMLYRFAFEVQIGDHIIFPSKINRQINIGQVVGDYTFVGQENTGADEPEGSPRYVHTRKVKWLKHLPRTAFTQGALYEVGSALTFFTVKNYADEYLNALNDSFKKATEITKDDEEQIEETAESIRENTRDYILKELSRHYKGYDLEDFVAALLDAMGYKTQTSPRGGDRGKDIIAYKDELPPRILVQVKSSDGDITETLLQAFKGTLLAGDYGLFVTLADYKKNAKDFLKNNTIIRAINGSELVDLVIKYYDLLDLKFKVHIPLEKVYIPVKKQTQLSNAEKI